MKSDAEIIEELKSATAGLFVMSESDYPLETFCWDGQIAITADYLRGISAAKSEARIEETDLETFFKMSGLFRNVEALIRQSLTAVKVYKVGAINIPVYIVGRSPAGNWIGLSTRLVQT